MCAGQFQSVFVPPSMWKAQEKLDIRAALQSAGLSAEATSSTWARRFSCKHSFGPSALVFALSFLCAAYIPMTCQILLSVVSASRNLARPISALSAFLVCFFVSCGTTTMPDVTCVVAQSRTRRSRPRPQSSARTERPLPRLLPLPRCLPPPSRIN